MKPNKRVPKWIAERRAKVNAWRLAHKDEINARRREKWKNFSKEEKQKVLDRNQAYREANRRHVNDWVNAYNASRPDKKRLASRTSMRKRRKSVVDHYGGRCECCGEKHYEFLQISHKDQNGVPSARRLGGNSRVISAIIKTWPKNIQVLCANCHQAVDLYGGCPHKRHSVTPL